MESDVRLISCMYRVYIGDLLIISTDDFDLAWSKTKEYKSRGHDATLELW